MTTGITLAFYHKISNYQKMIAIIISSINVHSCFISILLSYLWSYYSIYFISIFFLSFSMELLESCVRTVVQQNSINDSGIQIKLKKTLTTHFERKWI